MSKDASSENEIERLKELFSKELVLAAVEVPVSDKGRSFHSNAEEMLALFDEEADDLNVAHFIVRVKRSSKPLPTSGSTTDSAPLPLSQLVDETFNLTNEIAEKRNKSIQNHQEYSPEFLLENARLLEQSGEIALARTIYQALIKNGTDISEGLLGLARTFEIENALEDAEKYYREALVYRSSVSTYSSLISAQICLGKDEEAVESLIFALALPEISKREQFEFHKSIGNCFTRLGQLDKAEFHYRKAFEFNPKSDSLQVNVGSLAIQKGDLESAAAHFKKALELNALNEKALNGLGLVAFSQNEFQKAHDYFFKSLELQIKNVSAIYNIVKCSYELKNYDAAIKLIEQFLQTSPSNGTSNLNIQYSYCGLLLHSGRLNIALQETDKILELNPNHSGAKELKAIIADQLQRNK